jgi:hypothetical protein
MGENRSAGCPQFPVPCNQGFGRVPPLRSGPGCARRRARYNCAQRRRAPGAHPPRSVSATSVHARRCLAPAGAHPSRERPTANGERVPAGCVPGGWKPRLEHHEVRLRGLGGQAGSPHARPLPQRHPRRAIEFSPLREARAGRGRGRGPSRAPVRCSSAILELFGHSPRRSPPPTSPRRNTPLDLSPNRGYTMRPFTASRSRRRNKVANRG